jgi:hypothetical protein
MSGPNTVAPVIASAAKQSSYPRDSPSTRWQVWSRSPLFPLQWALADEARTKQRACGGGTVDCVAALAMTVVVA